MTQMSTTTTSGSVFQPNESNVQLPSTVLTTSYVQQVAAIAPAPANISSGKFNDNYMNSFS